MRGDVGAATEDEGAETRELLVEVRQHFADVGSFGSDLLAVARHLAERRRDVYGDCGHFRTCAFYSGKRRVRVGPVRQRVDDAALSV